MGGTAAAQLQIPRMVAPLRAASGRSSRKISFEAPLAHQLPGGQVGHNLLGRGPHGNTARVFLGQIQVRQAGHHPLAGSPIAAA